MEEAKSRMTETVTDSEYIKLRDKYSVGIPAFTEFGIPGKYRHLQIDLGKFPGTFCVQEADYTEKIMGICCAMDGTINFQDRL